MTNILDRLDLQNILSVGERAARDAGSYLRQMLGQAHIKHQKAINDDLLDVDLESERLILTRLHQETPELAILSEETFPEAQSNNYWIVDPLDGSANFQHGTSLFAIAIALVLNHTTAAGIIYLPMQDEMFTAIQGQGTFLNNQPIHVSNTDAIEKAVAHLGDLAKGNGEAVTYKHTNDILKLAAKTYRVRMIGTAATDLAYVACGRADLLVNHATALWDIEAGKLILTEAGGKSTTKTIGDRIINIYSNGKLHEIAEQLIADESLCD